MTDVLFAIPSPPINGFALGPLKLHFYALCIVAGIAVAVWLSNRRWRARGGDREDLESVLVWAVLFGFVGARLYHVITDYQLYFGPGRDWWRAFFIWEGGLGIWGAVALGAVGAWLGCRRRGVRMSSVADTVAPGLLIAQAIGRLGNWFNQELYGAPSTLPWAVSIDPAHRMAGYENIATYHPTFLYELLWNLAIAGVLLLLDRKFALGYGKLFWLYVVGYTAGRAWIEHLRIDAANRVGGFRINEFTSWGLFVLGLAIFAWLLKTRPGREESVRVSSAPAMVASPTELESLQDRDILAKESPVDGAPEAETVSRSD